MSLFSRNSPKQPGRQNESPLSDSRFGTQKALCNVPGICFSNPSSLNVKRRGRQALEFCTGAAVSLVQMDGHLSKWSSGSTADFETNFCEDNNNNDIKTVEKISPPKEAPPPPPRAPRYRKNESSGHSRHARRYLPRSSAVQNRSRGGLGGKRQFSRSLEDIMEVVKSPSFQERYRSVSPIEKKLWLPKTPFISDLSNNETGSSFGSLGIYDSYTLSNGRLGRRSSGLSKSLTNLSSKPAPSTSTVPELRSSHSSLLPSNVEYCDKKQFL